MIGSKNPNALLRTFTLPSKTQPTKTNPNINPHATQATQTYQNVVQSADANVSINGVAGNLSNPVVGTVAIGETYNLKPSGPYDFANDGQVTKTEISNYAVQSNKGAALAVLGNSLFGEGKAVNVAAKTADAQASKVLVNNYDKFAGADIRYNYVPEVNPNYIGALDVALIGLKDGNIDTISTSDIKTANTQAYLQPREPNPHGADPSAVYDPAKAPTPAPAPAPYPGSGTSGATSSSVPFFMNMISGTSSDSMWAYLCNFLNSVV